MIRTRSWRALSGFLVLAAVPALIWVAAPALEAKVPPAQVVPRVTLAPQVQTLPSRQRSVRIDPRFVVEPNTIDPGFVVNRSADIDPMIIATRPAVLYRK